MVFEFITERITECPKCHARYSTLAKHEHDCSFMYERGPTWHDQAKILRRIITPSDNPTYPKTRGDRCPTCMGTGTLNPPSRHGDFVIR